MTDYAGLIRRLRELQRYLGDNDAGEAANALEAQARRIAELEQMVAVLMRHEARDDTIKVQKARIAELEAALKIYAEARCSGMICAFDDGEAARAALEKSK